MKVTGIIMECNPFHEGHAYLLREARKRTEADYIIAAMSGDYVQRGEPAVFDKYIRAEQILTAGADLVLELPLYAACGSAEYFARGGVFLLERLGVVTDLCFGSESGDLSYILENARRLALLEDGLYSPTPDPDLRMNSCRDLYRKRLQAGLQTGLSYPAARAAALEAVFSDTLSRQNGKQPSRADISGRGDPFREKRSEEYQASGDRPSSWPSTPNDLLAVEYCRALISSHSPITPHAVPRICVPSATDRRRQLLENRRKGLFSVQNAGIQNTGIQNKSIQDKSIQNTNIQNTKDHTAGCNHPSGQLTGGQDRPSASPSEVPLFPLFADDFSGQLLYALRMHEQEAELFADISGDIADRIRTLLPRYRDYSSFCDLLKTRNLTRTRISRCLLHLLLQIRSDRLDHMSARGMALYARPLAMRRSAGPLFAAMKKHSSIPFVSKLSRASSLLSDDELTYLEEEIRAEELYTLTLAAAASKAALTPGPAAELCVPRAGSRRLIVL